MDFYSAEFMKTLWDNIWIAIIGGAAWIWQHLNGDIKAAKAVADAAVPREDFKGYVERMERARVEFRENVQQLFKELGEHFKDDKASQERVLDALNRQTDILTDRINSKMDKQK